MPPTPPTSTPSTNVYTRLPFADLIFLFSKLLQQLDKASQEDPVGIEEAVLDKGWVIYLCLRFLVSTVFQKLYWQQFLLLFLLGTAIYNKAILR